MRELQGAHSEQLHSCAIDQALAQLETTNGWKNRALLIPLLKKYDYMLDRVRKAVEALPVSEKVRLYAGPCA